MRPALRPKTCQPVNGAGAQTTAENDPAHFTLFGLRQACLGQGYLSGLGPATARAQQVCSMPLQTYYSRGQRANVSPRAHQLSGPPTRRL